MGTSIGTSLSVRACMLHRTAISMRRRCWTAAAQGRAPPPHVIFCMWPEHARIELIDARSDYCEGGISMRRETALTLILVLALGMILTMARSAGAMEARFTTLPIQSSTAWRSNPAANPIEVAVTAWFMDLGTISVTATAYPTSGPPVTLPVAFKGQASLSTSTSEGVFNVDASSLACPGKAYYLVVQASSGGIQSSATRFITCP